MPADEGVEYPGNSLPELFIILTFTLSISDFIAGCHIVTRLVCEPALRMYMPRAVSFRREVPAGSLAWLTSCPRIVNTFTVTARDVET